jgi:hypothetical protein
MDKVQVDYSIEVPINVKSDGNNFTDNQVKLEPLD